jgi:hypothetical protein
MSFSSLSPLTSATEPGIRGSGGFRNDMIDRSRTCLFSVPGPYMAQLGRILRYAGCINGSTCALRRQIEEAKTGRIIEEQFFDRDHMHLLKSVVLPETESECLQIIQQIKLRQISFEHVEYKLRKRYVDLLVRHWEPLIDRIIFDCIVYGFYLVRMKPDMELHEVPIVLDPMDYRISFCKNEFGQNEYTIRDLQVEAKILNETIDIYIMYPPNNDGQMTSPLSRLLNPTISMIHTRASLEHSNLMQQYPERVCTYPQPQAPQRPTGTYNPNFTGSGVPTPAAMFAGGLTPLGTPMTTPGNTDAKRFAAPSQPYYDEHQQQILQIRNMFQEMDGVPGGTQHMEEKVSSILAFQDRCNVRIRPPSAEDGHIVHHLSPGMNMFELNPPPPPPHFEYLMQAYREACQRVFNLPLERVSRKHVYASEKDILTEQAEEAAYPYAKHVETTFNLLANRIYGIYDEWKMVIKTIQDLHAITSVDRERIAQRKKKNPNYRPRKTKNMQSLEEFIEKEATLIRSRQALKAMIDPTPEPNEEQISQQILQDDDHVDIVLDQKQSQPTAEGRMLNELNDETDQSAVVEALMAVRDPTELSKSEYMALLKQKHEEIAEITESFLCIPETCSNSCGLTIRLNWLTDIQERIRKRDHPDEDTEEPDEALQHAHQHIQMLSKILHTNLKQQVDRKKGRVLPSTSSLVQQLNALEHMIRSNPYGNTRIFPESSGLENPFDISAEYRPDAIVYERGPIGTRKEDTVPTTTSRPSRMIGPPPKRPNRKFQRRALSKWFSKR